MCCLEAQGERCRLRARPEPQEPLAISDDRAADIVNEVEQIGSEMAVLCKQNDWNLGRQTHCVCVFERL